VRSLNAGILAITATFPEGRGYRFRPEPRDASDPRNPRDADHEGVAEDVVSNGQIVARAAEDGATYCCGVTFEAWFRAWQSVAGEPELDADDLRAMLADWFCPTMGHPGAAAALVDRGLGVPVEREDAIAGDLCQFWRSVDLASPSGHSVIFLGWGDGTIRYWSSQGATRGVGVHEERIGDGWTFAFARAVLP
jgi:hypothetical protein